MGETSSDARPRVLVLEDDQAQRRAIAKILGHEFIVNTVANGLEAFATLREQEYDVIVSDIRMPFLGGKSFYEQLEETMPQMARRVVFVTAWAHEPQTREFLGLTGQPVLGKPYSIDALSEAVRRVVERG